ncbi:hypothetical protein BJV78DRAFT_1239135 [Lactifluus subvellereus]|nr:hypothetical protein BJV78DRAFT_1239135 [Lactifluus subvellereus]
MSMLIGLLRYAHRSSTGIWYLLYQQCIIWIALTCVAEVPIVVGVFLSLGNPVLNVFRSSRFSI